MSIIVLLIGKQTAELSEQLFDLFVDILDIFAIPLIQSLFILLLVRLFILRAQLVIDLTFLLAFLLNQQFLNGGDSARDGLLVLQNAVQLRI